jgi:REP element-mobilizing transposase RayT
MLIQDGTADRVCVPDLGWQAKGAGAKRKGERPRVSHLTRAQIGVRLPVHVTLRVKRHVYNLRSRRCFAPIRRAFAAGHDRFGFRLNHFSVQGNHLHLIAEVENKRALSRGMQGLAIRIAKGLNRVMGKNGRVFDDRYYAHVLRTPSEVRRALDYLVRNYQRHFAPRISRDFCDPYACALFHGVDPPLTAASRTWLLSTART